MVNLTGSNLEKILFKVRLGKYQWGHLRWGIYGDLNRKYRSWQIPLETQRQLANHIPYQPVKKISIIISTRNRLAALKKYTLDSLGKLEPNPIDYEVIIVDNGSDDRTYNYLKTIGLPNNYKLIREVRPGICHAYNQALKMATGDVITFLEDDIRVDPQWLSRIFQHYRRGRYLLGYGYIYDVTRKKNINVGPRSQPEFKFIDGNISFRREIFDFVSFNDNIIFGDEGCDLMSQIFIFWPNFSYFIDQSPIYHYNQPSVFRDEGEISYNWTGKRMKSNMRVFWQINKHGLRRNLNIKAGLYPVKFWLKEIFFIPIELTFIRGDLKRLIKTKIKIYQQLLKIKSL